MTLGAEVVLPLLSDSSKLTKHRLKSERKTAAVQPSLVRKMIKFPLPKSHGASSTSRFEFSVNVQNLRQKLSISAFV